MQVDRVDPRDIQWEVEFPAYRVYFWRHASESDSSGWASEEWELQVDNVSDALAWAEENSKLRPFAVYARVPPADGIGLIRLFGSDPSRQ